MRGIFFDADAARDVERRLLADGFQVELGRAPYAGEDDDEDHPWTVVTDAPSVVLELLVEQHDGWLDDDVAPPQTPEPAPLPLAPRRLHRPRDPDPS